MKSYVIHHINGKLRDNDVSNLAVVDISENLEGSTMTNKEIEDHIMDCSRTLMANKVPEERRKFVSRYAVKFVVEHGDSKDIYPMRY
jgi:hypothetical protein